MSPRPETGVVEFDDVSKLYALGKRRAYFAAAWPFGAGVSRKRSLAALRDVSFRVEPGEAFALIGGNGAGKSTALKCLARLTRPTSGRIAAGGRIVPLVELGVGFHPDLTGADNVRFSAALAGLRGKAVDELLDRAVEFSELEQFINTPVKHYSSGMFARLSFAVAANLPAEILIVDEVLAVGDIAFQRKCYRLLSDLRRKGGKTLIFVSHNEWALNETCDRGVLLSHGQIVMEGDIATLLRAYHTAPGEQSAAATATQMGEHLRISHVELVVPEGTRRVSLHEPVALELDVVLAPDVASGTVGVALNNQDRQMIWACYSDEADIELLPGSKYRLRIEIDDVNMLPGPGLLQVAAFDRSSPILDASRILEIDVEGDGPLEGFGRGLVHAQSRWKILSRDDI
jgi:lipopolysaccharide transport system ATP-binding protein